MRIQTLLIVGLLSFFSTLSITYAQENDLTGKFLKYENLHAMARATMTAEAVKLKAIVATTWPLWDQRSQEIPSELPGGYKKSWLQSLKKFNKPLAISPKLLFQVCVLSPETIRAILSPELTPENLSVGSNLGAVAEVKSKINNKMFLLVERACQNAKVAFAERMKLATVNGHALNLDEKTAEKIAHTVFFPADFAKPTFRKKFEEMVPLFINVSYIVSSIVPVAAVWVSLTTIVGSGIGMKAAFPTPDIFNQKKVASITESNGVVLDLTEEEMKFL